jgi:hypothetical protein
MMDWDRITRTGARAPGVERLKSLARRCSSAPHSPAQNGDSNDESGEHEGQYENVYCGEVEAVILNHPAVREVAVFEIPDPAAQIKSEL